LQGRVRKLADVEAPSDLEGSVIAEILHCGESENVEHVARTSK